jgi:hypothetical protein
MSKMDIDPYIHIKIFKKAIQVNGETMEVDIINLYGFTFKNNIFEWGEIFVQDPKFPKLKLPQLWRRITLYENVRLR